LVAKTVINSKGTSGNPNLAAKEIPVDIMKRIDVTSSTRAAERLLEEADDDHHADEEDYHVQRRELYERRNVYQPGSHQDRDPDQRESEPEPPEEEGPTDDACED
jgi:hypothetical protein